MTDRRNPDDAPESHNAEQEDEPGQSQSVAEEALAGEARKASPLDSIKVHGGIDESDAEPDLIDRMRDMEQSGRIDMGAFAGEPNDDDEDETYGERDGEDAG